MKTFQSLCVPLNVIFVTLTVGITGLSSIGLPGLSAFAADWPQFRGPTGLGFTDEKDLPLKWGGKGEWEGKRRRAVTSFRFVFTGVDRG
jgi:hypothetical protein